MRLKAGATTSDKDSVAPPLVTVVMPARGAVTSTVSLTGLISAVNDMPIGNEGDAGRISEVLVEPGDRVRKGQVLARLNPITAQSQLDSAEATLDEVRANAAVAQSEWARAQRGDDIFSKEENERRRTTALTAQAKIRAAAAQVVDARNKLAHTIILAPTDGVVLTRSAEVGQIASPGSTVLFHVARDGQIEMRGQVAEQDLPRLALGQSATVRLDGLASTFTGTIWQIGAVIDATTRQGIVRLALPAADQNLRPGAFARADIDVGSAIGVLLPQTAVLRDEHGKYVLVVGRDNKLERREVIVAGARSEGLLVSHGLDGSERVVAIAGAFLRTGETVAIAAKAG
ncbi:MAG: efflux RND transporter periplasmic adaptor subunit [Pseudomonadota bacterium]|nr:efflux RND transporter periplasmic adaptor subunit [Pseudomonadota bacterium]